MANNPIVNDTPAEGVPGGAYLNQDGVLVDANGLSQAERDAHAQAAEIKRQADAAIAQIHADVAAQAVLARDEAAVAAASHA
jgi:hypothetical protein